MISLAPRNSLYPWRRVFLSLRLAPHGDGNFSGVRLRVRCHNNGRKNHEQPNNLRSLLGVRFLLVPLFVACCLCSSTVNLFAQVTFDWATVGNPNNPPDQLYASNVNPHNLRFGAVGYTYRISKYEVTNDQYTAFLNAVDPMGANPNLGGADPFLYNSEMSSNAFGGINFNSGAANGSKYQVKSGRDNNPVVFVSFFDAMRFTNWLENGQGSGSTESGVYTISDGLSETRSASATFFIPNENEWYKAAYHDPRTSAAGGPPGDDHYWFYPTQRDMEPSCDVPPGSANSANCGDRVSNLTNVGAYTNTTSFYGTYDQAGTGCDD